jgi:phage tail-like protein
MRIYYPRFSYLRAYLPAAYQDDSVSASFLDRYLANVEGFFTVIEGKIVHTPALFDVRTVRPEDMDWLAQWLGVALDLSWDERKRRLFLAHLPQIFRERGTKAGLERAIRLTLEPCPDNSLFDSTIWGSARCGGKFCRQSIFSVRVVERFLTGQAPGIVFSTPAITQAPQAATSTAWIPAYGAETLNQDFRDFLKGTYQTVNALNSSWGASYTGFDDTNITFPPLAPSNKAQKQDWRTFTGKLIFTYAPPTAADLPLYQDFLQASYTMISSLNATYQLSGIDVIPSFDSIQFPKALPPGGQALEDWIKFVAIVLPTQRNAHRFSVLVPIQMGDDEATQSLKIQIAQRIAEIEKPAHTWFDVQPYWAFFRAGDARLGQDTLLGRGSRFAALLLGRDSLAAGYLPYKEPWDVRTRTVLAGAPSRKKHCASRPHERCV